ncbi:MAG: hypothetical protein ACI9ND_002982 [Yoonia sp.]|jgi:hypothetical protein
MRLGGLLLDGQHPTEARDNRYLSEPVVGHNSAPF